MVGNFHMPPMGYGPGSQPSEEDGNELKYLQMPQDMSSYVTHLPEVEDTTHLQPALDLLADIAAAATAVGQGGENQTFDLSTLDKENRDLMAETLGEGEVAMKIRSIPAIGVQESVFAGVWVLGGANVDAVEVGAVPRAARDEAFTAKREPTGEKTPRTPSVVNAPPLLVELEDKSRAFTPETDTHVVNLTLLPHTEDDLAWLEQAMGQGAVEILSRGYGNCRVTATALPHVWQVRFYNSMDVLILDTYEVTAMPEVAIAAPEDLIDSGERIVEVLEAIR
ncbi:hydrogenase expression/formation protein [Epibacterium sp. SM1979]|uniref:Hydrogenase expression/formation protein n=1 Tax=Tritonibacter litoralis TaxID=2662264 RepID=A0A843Y8Q1_9RHOB|nr:hydrogenase expression/formation protein [Tritonibacter litoralis]MQQ07266.1 hydrogenase expression/formation protein [Tritonibacter litoralis]